MAKKINIIICEPNTPPRVETVEEKLETWQEITGGIIDVIYPHDDDSCIILNDEGKIINLPMNRSLRDELGNPYDVICGTFAIVRAPQDSDTFESLTDEQIARYMKQYADYLTEEETESLGEMAQPHMSFVPIDINRGAIVNGLPWWLID